MCGETRPQWHDASLSRFFSFCFFSCAALDAPIDSPPLRELLRPGMKADVAIFDPAAVTDKATFEQPHRYAEGVIHVIVNGKVILQDGKMTPERPGRVLYGPAYLADGRR